MSTGLGSFAQALRIIRQHRELAHFVGPRDPGLIDQAQAALGATFPPSYREFLLQLGAGSFAGEEFYGVIDDNFDHSGVPNGVWLNLDDRRKGYVPPHLLVVYGTGDGAYYAIDVSRKDCEAEAPIVEWVPGLMGSAVAPSQRFASFGDLFLHLIASAAERASK